MRPVEIGLDGLLCLLLLVLAWKALRAPHLYQSAIYFIALGLVMALAWVRLAAPDVALAEAAIGTGLLGVLLIDSLRVFARDSKTDPDAESEEPPPGEINVYPAGSARPSGRTLPMILVTASCGLLAILLVEAIIELPDGGGLTAAAQENLERSGVDHPVTAVLLNYRGYDTWLEVGVLLLAMLGIFCAGGRVGFAETRQSNPPGHLLSWLIRALAPLMILAAAYLLWLGKLAPGGAFQSGVILGSAGILLRLAGFQVISRLPPLAVKLGLLLGFGVFLIFGGAALLTGRAFLEYPEARAGELILLVETAAAVSIGFTIFAFFAYLNSRDQPEAQENHAREEGGNQKP